MKTRIILSALCASMLLGSCRYNDTEIWNAVNKQEERISALEKWQTSVEKQLNALQGILTATDYVTGVERVTKDGAMGYKFMFLHAEPITLYYNDNNEVSGTSDKTIGVMQDNEGYYWTMGGQPLMLEGKKVYVKGGEQPTLTPNEQNPELFDLMIGGSTVTIDPRVVGPHPVKSVVEQNGKVVITLNDNTTKELVKWVDFSSYLLPEYTSDQPGEKTHPINLPEGFIMRPIGDIPSGWLVSVVGKGAQTQLKVTYPNQGDATISFIISDGKATSIIKEITFKAAADPAATWVTVHFDGSNPISIPAGAVSVKVTGTTSAPAMLLNNICTPLKNSTTVRHIDLSEVAHSGAIPANAFFKNGMASEPAHESNFNRTIETIKLPKSYNGKIFNYAFKNCSALREIIIPSTATSLSFPQNALEGCISLQKIRVPQNLVSTYQNLSTLQEHRDKIEAI